MAKVTTRKETGRLVIDFTYRGVRCREQTALADTSANRKRVEIALAKLKVAIAAGTFVYREFFPGSLLAERFEVPSAARGAPVTRASSIVESAGDAPPSPASPAFKEFTATWLAERQVEWRRSHIKVLKSTLDQHLLAKFGERPEPPRFLRRLQPLRRWSHEEVN